MTILGSYYSLFSRQVVSSNGRTLETIEKPSELVSLILNQNLNPAEKIGMANNFGFYADRTTATEGDVTFNICQVLNTGAAGLTTLTNNGKSMTFALPIIGLLNSGAKFIPLINGDITLELTVNPSSNWLLGLTANAKTAAESTVTFTIQNLELVFDQVNLTPESYNLIMSQYPEKIHLKSQSYDFASSASLSITPSAIDIPINIKRSSLKQILFYFNQADDINKTYGGTNININDIVFISNGLQYPQRPIRVNTNPSEVYNQVQKAYGSLYSATHAGSSGKQEFCRRTTGSANYYEMVNNSVTSNALISSNKFYLAIDTEIINYDSDSLYSGVAMGVNSNFRVNIGGDATGKTATLYSWFCYDAILEFDLVNGITSVIA
jgi:hypothetical protein